MADCTRSWIARPLVRRELQCQLSPVLMRRQYIQNKESFALTGDGMLGVEAPGSHPVSLGPRGSAASGHVGQMHGAHQLWAASRPSPSQDPPCRGCLCSDQRWTQSSWPSALRLPPGSGPADSPGWAREGRDRRVEGSTDHIAAASPAPQPQTLPSSVLGAVRSLLSRTIHRGRCPGPCWTSPLGWAGWTGSF